MSWKPCIFSFSSPDWSLREKLEFVVDKKNEGRNPNEHIILTNSRLIRRYVEDGLMKDLDELGWKESDNA